MSSKSEKRIAVLGCPRSGTRFMASVLSYSGYPTGHENYNYPSVIDWQMLGTMSATEIRKRFDIILHQVRHPFSFVRSMPTIQLNSVAFIQAMVPSVRDARDPKQALIFWEHWNRRCRATADFTYKVEDLKELIPTFKERFDICIDPETIDRYTDVPKKINSRTNRNTYITNLAQYELELPKLAIELNYGPNEEAARKD